MRWGLVVGILVFSLTTLSETHLMDPDKKRAKVFVDSFFFFYIILHRIHDLDNNQFKNQFSVIILPTEHFLDLFLFTIQ